MRLVLLILIVEELGVVVLLHELLGWLVNVHVCHLLLSLASLLLSGRLRLLLGLLLGLDSLELIEHVLVVEQSVGKLILEDLLVKETLDAPLNHWDFQKLVDCGSLLGVSLQHH